MLLKEGQINRLTYVAPKLIYGTIILTAVVGSLGSPLPKNVVIVVTVFLTMLAVSIANAFANLIRDDIANRRITPWMRKWKVLFTPSWVMASTVVPVAFFGLATAGLIGQRTAFYATKAGLVILLVYFGFVARRASGGGVLGSLWSGSTIALLGYAVVQVKVWTKYLPKIGY